MTIRSVIGDAPKRREDLRFVSGTGRYLDDLAFEDLAHAVVLRSMHAYARIERVLIEKARAAPGVLAVLTAEDVRADGLKPLRPSAEANVQTGEKFAFEPQPLLAEGKIRYAGEPVALIVAESRAQALDAAEQLVVDYAPLPAVTTAVAARASGAPEISPKSRQMSASTGAPAIPPQSMRRSPQRPTSSSCSSTITASSPTRSSRAVLLGFGMRIAADTRLTFRARASTRPATTPPARWALLRRRCGL